MSHSPHNALSPLASNKRLLAAICLGMIAGFLFVGLAPFDFHPKNMVAWEAGRNGLVFGGAEGHLRDNAGVAFTPKPLAPPSGAGVSSGSITLEAWLLPWVEPRGRRSRIISFEDEAKNETLFVAQWSDHLLVWRLGIDASGHKRYREIGVDKALPRGKTRFATITSDMQGTAFYLEGELAERLPGIRLIAKDDAPGGRLFVGNSPDARNSFSGEILGVAVYDRALTPAQVRRSYEWWSQGAHPPPPAPEGLIALYPFGERRGTEARGVAGAPNPLWIPEEIHFEKRILDPPSLEDVKGIGGVVDVAVNIAGFVPLGFALCLWLRSVFPWRRRRVLLVAGAVGVSLSLSIELLQVFLPARSSSQTDLLCNSLGTVVGVILFSVRTDRRSRESVRPVS